MNRNDEETDSLLDYYETFISIDEFIDVLDINNFMIMCSDVLDFDDQDGYSKRSIINNSINKKSYLLKMFPCFLIDLLGFLNVYEASEVLEDYYQRLPNYQDKDIALNDSLGFGVRFLMNIEDINFLNYRLILLDMLEVYYKYTNYLNQDIENLEETECIILDIENNLNALIYCSVDNIELLKAIVEAYIKYNLLSADEKQKVQDYYSDPCKKKKLLKVSKNCQKLKHDED